jgi:hypothetical protein
MRVLKIFLVITIIVVLAVLFLNLKMKNFRRQQKNMIYGVSFNSEYAGYLGLDAKKVFTKILDEWNFRYIRLSAQWDLIEKTRGKYDWQDLDWQMNTAKSRKAKVMLAVGQKTPRWPECHNPSWVSSSAEQKKAEIENFIQIVVERYKNNSALEIWQVENEPFLQFGTCPKLSMTDLRDEIDLVKKLDPIHPIITSDSGELSLWHKAANVTDLFGTTLYRVVWNKYVGYWSYDWVFPAFVYRAKLWFNNRDINTAYITELQAESWIPSKSLMENSLAEQYKSMSLDRLKKNIEFADKTGMPRAYLWGGEWWYWLESKGEKAIPDFIKELKKE